MVTFLRRRSRASSYCFASIRVMAYKHNGSQGNRKSSRRKFSPPSTPRPPRLSIHHLTKKFSAVSAISAVKALQHSVEQRAANLIRDKHYNLKNNLVSQNRCPTRFL